MKSRKIFEPICGNRYGIIIAICLLILLFAVVIAKGEDISSTQFISKEQGGALSITSRKMTLKNQENTILFEGDVVVDRDTMRLKANKVEVVFIPQPEVEQGVAERKREISTITATGDVEFVQGMRTILSNRVVYHRKDEKMVFTGSPNVKEGEDKLRGERITVFIKEDRVVVEGGEAIIHPR